MTKTSNWVLNFRQSYQDLLRQGWVWSLVLKIYLFFSASSLYCFWSFSFLMSFSFMLGHSPDLEFKTILLCTGNFFLNFFIILSRAFLVNLWTHSHNSRPILRLPKKSNFETSKKVSLLAAKVVNGVWVDYCLQRSKSWGRAILHICHQFHQYICGEKFAMWRNFRCMTYPEKSEISSYGE